MFDIFSSCTETMKLGYELRSIAMPLLRSKKEMQDVIQGQNILDFIVI